MFIEHRMLHPQRGHVPAEDYTVPFGKARVLGKGSDITLVGISYMAVECLRAQRYLDGVGISAEVIDPVSLSPLDIDTIITSVKKTGRLLVVDSAWTMCGVSAEILARVAEHLQGTPHFRWQRIGFAPVTCPTTKNLENLFYPNAQTVASAAFAMVHDNQKSWAPEHDEAPEILEFKGPF
jgi:pyruvate/2-oxoglutarate/acetoin dehydrogenase E1 component